MKILDLGLARFFNDDEDMLTKKFDENVLGTADYLAPEQAIDSHAVDGRADIYSLGATFYFLLTGNPPFSEGTVAQKLLWHQNRSPKPVREVRQDVPADVTAVLQKMMAKKAEDRYQTPAELAEALLPFTQTPIPPPPDAEMPTLSVAAMGVGPRRRSRRPPRGRPQPPDPGPDDGTPGPRPRSAWQTPIPGGPPASRSSSRSRIPPPAPPSGRPSARKRQTPRRRTPTAASASRGPAAGSKGSRPSRRPPNRSRARRRRRHRRRTRTRKSSAAVNIAACPSRS